MTTSRQSVAQASNFSRTFSRTLLTSALALSLTLAGTGERAFAFDQATLIGLNNDGVRAINQQNYPLAIQKLEEAMKMDPTYRKAGITYQLLQQLWRQLSKTIRLKQ